MKQVHNVWNLIIIDQFIFHGNKPSHRIDEKVPQTQRVTAKAPPHNPNDRGFNFPFVLLGRSTKFNYLLKFDYLVLRCLPRAQRTVRQPWRIWAAIVN